MKILVTGADGFAGSWLVRALLRAGHRVTGSSRSGVPHSAILSAEEQAAVTWLPLELTAPESVAGLSGGGWDAIAHLAAASSGSEARKDPGRAWAINAAGTARLVNWFGSEVERGEADPLFLLVSTGEVYGHGTGAAHREIDPAEPASPYAASKLGAEVATLETARRTRLRVAIARAFPHTGPHQDPRFVVPVLAQRLRIAKRAKAPAINTGNLEPVRDLLDVRDVVAAYAGLLEQGRPGEIYNVCSGLGRRLSEILDRLMDLVGYRVITEYDQALARRGDIAHLVGDAGKLRAVTGWRPTISLDQTLQDLLDAQAD